MFNVVNSSPLPLDEVFQEWILLLLNLTEEATASVLEQCLQEVLSQQYTVTRKYHSYVSFDFTQVSDLIYIIISFRHTMYSSFFVDN